MEFRTLAVATLAATLFVGPAGFAQTAAQPQKPQQGQAAAGQAGSARQDSAAMERLRQATERLRYSVQAMAQEPAGPARNKAMEQAREALLETQQAMIDLPPDLRVGGARPADEGRAWEQLKDAAEELRASIDAMTKQPMGVGRAVALDEVRQALVNTNQAMLQMPLEMRRD